MSENSVSYVGAPSVTGSYQCQGCGAWLNGSVLHLCPTKQNIYATQPIASTLDRIAVALEKIADNCISADEVTMQTMRTIGRLLVDSAK